MNLLWVDSLCIIQDDPEELDLEIANMAAYYKNAQLTIVAAVSPSCNHGFLAPSNDTHGPKGFEFLLSADNITDTGRIRLSSLGGVSEEVIDTRAWTLQEGLLSTRVASFGKEIISWSCLSSDYGRAYIGELRKALRDSRSWSKITIRDWRDVPERHSYPSYWASLGSHYHDAWHEIICRYCDRHLSVEADGLVAISGIASEFSFSLWPIDIPGTPSELSELSSSHKKTSRPNYVAGLWDSAHLPLQLLWRPRLSGPRQHSSVYVAPSWSWASARAPLCRDEKTHKVWLTNAEASVFKVLRYELALRNESAPFGALTSGSMLVRGLSCTTNISSILRYDRGTIQITLDTGADSSGRWGRGLLKELPPEQREAPITLLEIVSLQPQVSTKERDDIMDYPRGLVLAGTDDGNYRRIGLCYYTGAASKGKGTNGDPWEMRTFTLV